jgi:hypothetical protein
VTGKKLRSRLKPQALNGTPKRLDDNLATVTVTGSSPAQDTETKKKKHGQVQRLDHAGGR